MATALDRLAYRAGQQLRLSWYFGQYWVTAKLAPRVPMDPALKERMPDRARIVADLRALLEQDWRNIEVGYYRRPESMTGDPFTALRKAGSYFADLPRVHARRRTGANDEVFRAVPRGRYPRYYLQNFHFQTDGYLSRRSAELYDHQVEVLFGGAAAAMRRQALVPVAGVIARQGVRRTRLIDLGCGTGSFLREVKNNYPKLAVTALDLSPDYLALAREALAPWSGAEFIAAPVEAVPAPDASFDIATAIFLFHELPAKVRRGVAQEMGRMLRPGGRAILVDSIQQGDVPDYDALIEHFPRVFHEPYYAGYARENLAGLFAGSGLRLVDSRIAYLSKVMTFERVSRTGSERALR